MTKNSKIIVRSIRVGLKPEDHQRMLDGLANSPCRSVSEYCRLILAGKPVPQYYRNKSFDDFMKEAILLRKELQALREKGSYDLADQQRLLDILDQIKDSINRMADICM